MLGNATNDFEITDSEVICETLVVRSRVFIVQSSAPAQEVRISAQGYEQIPATIDVKTRGPGQLAVSWPGAKQYPWAKYVSEATGGRHGRGVQDAFLALRRILTWFRRDKKQDLARHRDLIVNVAVGDSHLRRGILEFLLQQRLIYEEEPLFKLDSDRLSGAGINYFDLRLGRTSDAVATFLSGFEDWLKQQPG